MAQDCDPIASILLTGDIAQCKSVISLSYMEVWDCDQGFLPLSTQAPLQS